MLLTSDRSTNTTTAKEEEEPNLNLPRLNRQPVVVGTRIANVADGSVECRRTVKIMIMLRHTAEKRANYVEVAEVQAQVGFRRHVCTYVYCSFHSK